MLQSFCLTHACQDYDWLRTPHTVKPVCKTTAAWKFLQEFVSVPNMSKSMQMVANKLCGRTWMMQAWTQCHPALSFINSKFSTVFLPCQKIKGTQSFSDVKAVLFLLFCAQWNCQFETVLVQKCLLHFFQSTALLVPPANKSNLFTL